MAIDREAVPPAVRRRTEFTHPCPDSATCMRLDLGWGPPATRRGPRGRSLLAGVEHPDHVVLPDRILADDDAAVVHHDDVVGVGEGVLGGEPL